MLRAYNTEFWKKQLDKSHKYIQIPSDFCKIRERNIKVITKKLSSEVYTAIEKVCNKSAYSKFLLFLSCYSILIAKLSDSYQFEVMTPEFLTEIPEKRYLLLPIKIDKDITLKEQLLVIADTVEEMKKHDAADLPMLMNQMEIDSKSYRFGISSSDLHCSSSIAYMDNQYFLHYNLNIIHDELELKYDSSYFQEETADLFCERLMSLLEEMTKKIDKKVGDVNWFVEKEYKKILEEFVKGSEDDWRLDITICDHFLEKVKENPLKIAVEQGERRLSYEELDYKSDIVAESILNMYGEGNYFVGIMLERSVEMIIGIIGILKAGCAYVPISPKYPVERVNFMIQDANLKMLLTVSEYVDFVQNIDTVIDLNAPQLYDREIVRHINKAKPEDIMYIIYTSGSTGNPKGVLISHKAFMNRIYWMNKEYPITGNDVVMQKTSFTFDVSVWELFWWTITGAKLVLLEKDCEYNPSAIVNTIERSNVTVMHFVPSMLHVFLNQLDNRMISSLSSLKYVFSSGEELSAANVENFLNLFKNKATRLINLYGPTEATIDVTYYDCAEADLYSRIPIGRPISNHKIYILDEQYKICPIGMQGELCIAGAGLAESYLNRKELTNEAFIYIQPDKNHDTKERIYKTGDIARWNCKGLIEYIGRKDEQIKLRGYRIEIQEIESVLSEYAEVKETAVVFDKQEAVLTAFYVSDIQIEKQSLREYLQTHIPQYMIPNDFVQVSGIPKTSHGKLDKKSLLCMKQEISNRDENELLLKYKPLLDVFRDELHREINRLNESFFALGGDSLKAIMITSKFAKMNYTVNVNELFSSQSIGEICEKIIKNHAMKVSDDSTNDDSLFRLTPIQLDFLDKRYTDSDYYNIAIMLHKKGKIDSEIIGQSLEQIIGLHNVLNTNIKTIDNQYHMCRCSQSVKPYILKEVDLTGIAQDNRQECIMNENANIQRTFSIEKSPLIGCIIFYEEEQSQIFLAIHHLLMDGVSLRIVLEELGEIYEALSAGKEPSLVPEITTYGRYSQYLYELAESDKIKSELQYWNEIVNSFARTIFSIDREFDYKLRNVTQMKIAFNESETQRVLDCVNKERNIDLYSLLLTALGMSLHEISGKHDFVISIEKNGRGILSNDINLSRTVGWIANIFPVAISVKADDIAATFHGVQNTLSQVKNDGIGYLLLKNLGKQESLQAEPQVIINYLGEMIPDDTIKNFSISRYDTGTSVSLDMERKYILDIKGYRLQNELHFTIDYYKDILAESVMHYFGTAFKITLIRIAEIVSNIDYIVSKSVSTAGNMELLLSAIEGMDLQETE